MPAQYQGASYPARDLEAVHEAALADVPKRDFPKSSSLSGGKFLTSWGGSTYLAPALTVKDYKNGSGPVATYQGDAGQGGGQGGKATSRPPRPRRRRPRGRRFAPGVDRAHATPAASTAAPPPPTDPPATAPPASGPPAP